MYCRFGDSVARAATVTSAATIECRSPIVESASSVGVEVSGNAQVRNLGSLVFYVRSSMIQKSSFRLRKGCRFDLPRMFRTSGI